jgi:hypothetical protein
VFARPSRSLLLAVSGPHFVGVLNRSVYPAFPGFDNVQKAEMTASPIRRMGTSVRTAGGSLVERHDAHQHRAACVEGAVTSLVEPPRAPDLAPQRERACEFAPHLRPRLCAQASGTESHP